jgi:hypothetical protein
MASRRCRADDPVKMDSSIVSDQRLLLSSYQWAEALDITLFLRSMSFEHAFGPSVRRQMLRQFFVGWRNLVKLCNHLFYVTQVWRARVIRNCVF